MKNFWKYLIIILVLYIYIHNPYIYFGGMRMGSIKFLYIPAIWYLFFKSHCVKTFFKSFNTEKNIFFVVFFFVVLRTLLGGQILYLWEIIVSFVEVMLVPCFIIALLAKSGYSSYNSMIKCVLVIGAIATIISMLCIAIPPINDFVRTNILHITSDMRAFEHSFRGFGISESVSSQYGYVQGIMVVLGMMFLKSNRWFLYFIPFVLLSAFVNARTGVLVAISGVVVYLVYNRNYGYSFLILAISVLLISHFNAILELVIPNEQTRFWITDFIEQMDAVMDEGVEGSRQTNILFGQMIVLPETPEQWIIGRGFNLYRNEMGVDASDVGFIQQLNYGGIIYLLLNLYFIIYATIRLLQSKNKLYGFFFLLVFVILNIKSHYILNSGAFRIMMFIYYIYFLNQVKRSMI